MARPPESLNRILSHLGTLNGGEIRAKELCTLLDMRSDTLIRATLQAVGRGEIRKRAEGREVWYSQGDGEPPAVQPAKGIGAIEFYLYHDGDLVIEGLIENEDGTHTIPAAVLARMRTLYGWHR